VNLDWRTHRQRIFDGEADLFMLGWMPDYGHPENSIEPILCSRFTAYGPWDATLCDQVQAARAEHDVQTLEGIYESLSRHVRDTLPLVPVAHAREVVIMRRNVYGAVPSAMFAASFKDVCFGMSIYLPVVIRDSGL